MQIVCKGHCSPCRQKTLSVINEDSHSDHTVPSKQTAAATPDKQIGKYDLIFALPPHLTYSNCTGSLLCIIACILNCCSCS